MDDFLMEVLGPDAARLSVLDVGCGTGRLLARLSEAGATELAGADVAPRMLAIAGARLAQADADLRVADVEQELPWPEAAFDVVAVTGVFHHFLRPAEALTEMKRVLVPGGRLVLVDACFFLPVRQLMNAAMRIRPRDGDFRFYSARTSRRFLSQSGFRVSLVRRLNWWSYGIVAERLPVHT